MERPPKPSNPDNPNASVTTFPLKIWFGDGNCFFLYQFDNINNRSKQIFIFQVSHIQGMPELLMGVVCSLIRHWYSTADWTNTEPTCVSANDHESTGYLSLKFQFPFKNPYENVEKIWRKF